MRGNFWLESTLSLQALRSEEDRIQKQNILLSEVFPSGVPGGQKLSRISLPHKALSKYRHFG